MDISCETHMLGDAVDLLSDIHMRLGTKHGPEFRALDRQIEALISVREKMFKIHYLGGGKFVAAPSPDFTAVLTRSRELGIID